MTTTSFPSPEAGSLRQLSSRPASDTTERRRWSTLRSMLWPMVGLLMLEFLLGMTLDLYVALPTGSPGTVLASSPVLIVHLVVGLLLLGITLRALLVASRIGESRLLGASGLAFGSAVVAFGAGSAFAFAGQNPAMSFVMSAGFIGIFLAALLLFWWTSAEHQRAEQGIDAEPSGRDVPSES